MGVSATHLDWTMVPYVRKSFYKHFVDALEYVDHGWTGNKTTNFYDLDGREHNISSDLPIDSPEYSTMPDAYQYAMSMTERETHQAAEGLFHNLNTLQSRSGNQLGWL